jgi:hypothetical protein
MFRFCDAHSIPAVCIPPGTRLLVRDIPAKLRHECGLPEAEEAVFTQMTATAITYRNAVRFRNEVEVLLQRFAEGRGVRGLDTSSTEERETAPNEQQPVVFWLDWVLPYLRLSRYRLARNETA